MNKKLLTALEILSWINALAMLAVVLMSLFWKPFSITGAIVTPICMSVINHSVSMRVKRNEEGEAIQIALYACIIGTIAAIVTCIIIALRAFH